MRKAISLLAVAALMFVGFAPTAGASSASRPFRAVYEGSLAFVTDASCAPFGLRTLATGTGTASRLGLSAVTSSHCSSLAEYEGTGMLVAANGDKLFFDYGGVAPPLPSTIGELEVISGDYEVTGGTGRFEGAEGGWHMTAYVVYEGLEDFEWPGTFYFQGTIEH